jgi:hypothetical protein
MNQAPTSRMPTLVGSARYFAQAEGNCLWNIRSLSVVDHREGRRR